MPDAAIFAAYAHDQAHEGAEDRGHVSVHPDRRLKFPDRGIARMADGVERQAGPRLAAVAHDLKPAVTAIQVLADGSGAGCAGPPKPSIRTTRCPPLHGRPHGRPLREFAGMISGVQWHRGCGGAKEGRQCDH
jgi:hypothetical protein